MFKSEINLENQYTIYQNRYRKTFEQFIWNTIHFWTYGPPYRTGTDKSREQGKISYEIVGLVMD